MKDPTSSDQEAVGLPAEQRVQTRRQRLRSVGDRHGDGIGAVTVADLDCSVIHGVTAGDCNQRHADQLGVLELAPGETFLRSS